MNTKSTDFIKSTSCVSWRPWFEAQGYVDICPIISPTKRMELRRINTTGEDRTPSGRLLIDVVSYIISTSILTAQAMTTLHVYGLVSCFPSAPLLTPKPMTSDTP